MVNMAITQDDFIIAHRVEKKRKAPTGPSGAQPPRYCLVQNTVPRAPQRNPSLDRWVFRPPQQQLDLLCLNNNSLGQGQVFNSPTV
jgi:hypothetical protein